jgi:hypothetical protein
MEMIRDPHANPAWAVLDAETEGEVEVLATAVSKAVTQWFLRIVRKTSGERRLPEKMKRNAAPRLRGRQESTGSSSVPPGRRS